MLCSAEEATRVVAKSSGKHGSHAAGDLPEPGVNGAFAPGSSRDSKDYATLTAVSEEVAMFGGKIVSQLLITALFALSLSFLTFAASFAEVPRSEYLPASSVSSQ